jgi:hypothetical protein
VTVAGTDAAAPRELTNLVAAVNAVTGALVGGPDLGAGFVTAKPKGIVTIFGTAFCATDPVVAPGDFPAGVAMVTGAYIR